MRSGGYTRLMGTQHHPLVLQHIPPIAPEPFAGASPNFARSSAKRFPRESTKTGLLARLPAVCNIFCPGLSKAPASSPPSPSAVRPTIRHSPSVPWLQEPFLSSAIHLHELTSQQLISYTGSPQGTIVVPLLSTGRRRISDPEPGSSSTSTEASPWQSPPSPGIPASASIVN